LSAAEGIASGPSWPWWKLSAGLFGGALLCVILWIVITHAGAHKFGSQPPLTVAGASLHLVRGGGHPDETSFLLESAEDGVAALSADVRPFEARDYPRVEWVVRAAEVPAGLAFAWRTRENPRRSYSKPLQWLAGHIAPMSLDDSDGWRGTITGIGLVARGPLTAPIEVVSVHLPAASAGATLAQTFAQWAAPFPLKGYAIAFPFDAERAHFMPMAKAVAIAVALALVVYLLLARLRHWPADTRVLWAIFAAGWIVLDARWQVNLGRELALAAERFAGKTSEEKALAADDAAVYLLAQDVRRALPPPPVRIIILSDSDLIALRVAHFLYPHNVSRNAPAKVENRPRGAPPLHANLRGGDYLALVFYGSLGFDAERQLLVWPDGRTLPADVILSRPDLLLVRVR